MRSLSPRKPGGGPGKPAPGAEPLPGKEFERVAVVGLGLIGGSLALALRRSGFAGKILGVSRPETLEEARRLRAVDAGFGYQELAAAASQADLIILCSPIETILEHLDRLARCELRPGTVVTDVGSTKREILNRARQTLPAGVHFIGGHPMAGSEKRGMAAADPFLFQNAYYVLTRDGNVPPGELDRLGHFLSHRLGARVLLLEAEEHDRVAAAISHLPQLLAVTLVNSLEELGALREPALRLAAGGFRDMTRIASSPYEVWRDILATNRASIGDALSRFAAAVGKAAERLSGGIAREAELGGEFERAAAIRAGIPRDTKGFLRPLWEILVVVEDQPGVLARITEAIARRGINIQDIEVLKVREGEGGSLRLAFASRELAEEAVAILQADGISARPRE